MKTLAQKPILRFAHKSIVYTLVFCIVNMPAWALDWNSGTNATFNGSDTVTVDALRSIGIWNDFDTAPGQLIQFLTSGGGGLSSNHAVLNKVIGADPTLFEGILQGGQGHIILFNPNGITVGGTAVINAGRFTATTMGLMMSEQEFLNGNSSFEFAKGSGDPSAQIALLAGSDISAERVDLLAQKITNAGTITAGEGGIVIMAAGDRVFLSEAGSKVIVEIDSVSVPEVPAIDGLGDVVNEGTIEAAGGQIIMAAGDTYSRAIDGVDQMTLAVNSGTGRVGQFGTLNADALEGDGGSITLTAADTVVLGSDSVTSANAGINGDGGNIVVYSPDTALFRRGSLVEAKGGSESGNGGFFEISGKQLVETMGSIDLTGTQNGMFLIDPLDLWVVDDINIDIIEGPAGTWSPTNDASVSQLDVDDLESYLDAANVTLSTVGTVGTQEGDIVLDFDRELHSGASEISNNSLILEADHDIIFMDGSSINFEGDGHVELYASTRGDAPDYDGAVIAPATGTHPINVWTRKGDITIEAGSGGINMGVLQIGDENTAGEEAHLRLLTINGNDVAVDYGDALPDATPDDFDITVQHLDAEGRRYSSVYVESAGDLTINGSSSLGGSAHAKTNTTPTDGSSAKSHICLIADGDVYLTGTVYAEAHSDTQTDAAVWIGAGTHHQDPDNGYEGTVTLIKAGNPHIVQADSNSGGDRADATVRIYGSTVNVDGKVQSVSKNTKFTTPDNPGQSESGLNDADATYEIDPKEPDSTGSTPMYDKLTNGTRALVDIDVSKDGSCLNCANQITVLFVLNPDSDIINWRAGYTIEGIDFDPTFLDVLDNDVLPDNVTITSITIIPDGTSNGEVTLVGDELKYIPPSYDAGTEFEWDGVSPYATFEDSFTYQVEITTDEGDTFLSEGSALVTITVQNEVPTLSPDSDTIHMNTSADFDLSTLVVDNDGTPGTLTPGTLEGTYGTLDYDIVEGFIPVSNGQIATDSGVIPDTLTIAGDTVTYAPLDGYVSPAGLPTTFGYSVSDSSIVNAQGQAAPQSESLAVTVTNSLPGGDVVLDNASMDANAEVLGVAGGNGFSDAEDDFVIDGIVPATDDDNYGFGGTLDYNGTNNPAYVPGGDYTYSADTANLPGYVGEDDFVANLWDGQRAYSTDGTSEKVYGTGAIDLLVTNELPEGDSWLGTAQMDTALTDASLATDGFSSDVIDVEIDGISSDDYNKGFGGTLTYDGTDYDYDPTTMGLPGYVGDSGTVEDDFDNAGYVIGDNADDRFDVKLWDGQYDYAFKQVDGEWVVDTDNTAKVYGEGTISVDITNERPEGDSWLGTAQMDTALTDATLATDGFSSDVIGIEIDGVSSDDYNKGFGGTLTYDGTDYDYDPTTMGLPGYVGDSGTVEDDFDNAGYVIADNADDRFDVKLWDGEILYTFDAQGNITGQTKQYGTGTISVDITNERPEGDSWLGTAQMDTALTDATLATDGFSSDVIGIEIDGVSSDDYNKGFGGTLTYDGTDYDYDPTTMGLPGYVGDSGTVEDDFDNAGYVIADNADDRFDVKLWDGEILYTFDAQGNITGQTKQYGTGTISVDITNTPPEGDAGFGQVHMDSQNVTQNLENGFAGGITVQPGTYTDGSVIDNYGNRTDSYSGTLTYNGDGTWTYSAPESDLPGFVGDNADDFAAYSQETDGVNLHADNLFTVSLSNGEYDYWFSEDQAPDGYEYYEPGDIYRIANFSEGSGTVSIDITNALPTIDENVTVEHMNETISDQLFAQDNLDGNPINELDDLKTVAGSGSDVEVPGYTSNFGIDVTVDNDNPDGTSKYTYDPADGYVGTDEFGVTVWDGQRDYVFVDGEIASDTAVTVDGTVKLEYTNILPGGGGDLGTTDPGTPLTVIQIDARNGSPINVTDQYDPQQSQDDSLSIWVPDNSSPYFLGNGAGPLTGPDTYIGSAGGTLTFDGTKWVYTPAPGFTGTETFSVLVADGQKEYGDQYYGGEGYLGDVLSLATVTATVPSPTPNPNPVPVPVAPVAPLANYELPKLVGCPVELDAAASELAVNSDQLQLLIADAMATNPNLQPCEACQNLLVAASTLQSINERQLAAMNQIFNSLAPIDAPFTQEVALSINTEFARFRDMQPNLANMSDEQVEQFQQYAAAEAVVEAFVDYVAILDNDLRLPVGDSVALVMTKYGEQFEVSSNPNIAAYLLNRLVPAEAEAELEAEL